jgi:hypothetical protein
MKRTLRSIAAVCTVAISLGGLASTDSASATPNPAYPITTPCNTWAQDVGRTRLFMRGNYYSYTWYQGWLIVWDQGNPYQTYYWDWC